MRINSKSILNTIRELYSFNYGVSGIAIKLKLFTDVLAILRLTDMQVGKKLMVGRFLKIGKLIGLSSVGTNKWFNILEKGTWCCIPISKLQRCCYFG